MTRDEFENPDTSKQAAIDEQAEFWAEYLTLREYANKYKAWGKRFKQIFGDKDEITIGGKVVATHKIGGRVNEAQLRADHPGIFDAYCDEHVVKVFNAEAFAQNNPELANAYRSRTLIIKTDKN